MDYEAGKLRFATQSEEARSYGSSIGYTAPDESFLRALLTEFSCWVEAIARTDGDDCELGSRVTASLPVLSELRHSFASGASVSVPTSRLPRSV